MCVCVGMGGSGTGICKRMSLVWVDAWALKYITGSLILQYKCKISLGLWFLRSGISATDIFFVIYLFLKKSKYKYNNVRHTILHRRHLIYKNKTFCNTALKIQSPRTVSNGNHFLHTYSFCVEDRKFMVVFSILIQYFRNFRPPFILGLSPKHLFSTYKMSFPIALT